MGHQITSVPALLPVESSNVAALGHAGDLLRVQFKSGRIYRYVNVPRELYLRLLGADSIGSLLSKEIIKQPHLYPFEEEKEPPCASLPS